MLSLINIQYKSEYKEIRKNVKKHEQMNAETCGDDSDIAIYYHEFLLQLCT